jgi:hypothetical protein
MFYCHTLLHGVHDELAPLFRPPKKSTTAISSIYLLSMYIRESGTKEEIEKLQRAKAGRAGKAERNADIFSRHRRSRRFVME